MKKFLKIFENKEKRVENLIFLLVLLVITLIIINFIINSEEENNKESKESNKNKVFVSENIEKNGFEDIENEYINIELEDRLEKTLSKIKGVKNVDVLITYSETEEVIPIYNSNNSLKEIEEGTGDSKKITKEESINKNIIVDDSSNIIVQKKLSPKIEGAIIIAKGAEDLNVKSNIIKAVEAATGLALHKIQVFEMGDY